MNDDDYPYWVLDSWCHRNKTEPVAGLFRTKQAAEEFARAKNMTVNVDSNGLRRYIVFETQDEGYMQELESSSGYCRWCGDPPELHPSPSCTFYEHDGDDL